MNKLDLSKADFTFNTKALSDNELRVYSFSGREQISQPFAFRVSLTSEKADVDLEAQVGQAAVLGIRGRDPQGAPYTRYVHGVVERFVQTTAGEKESLYEATLVPTVLPLRYTRNSRIFQQMKTGDIAQKVLKDGKIPSDAVQTTLHGSYEPRDFCVQYQESDLDFVARLLEEEGIFYFFEHSDKKDSIVMGDGDHAIEPLPNGKELVFRETAHVYEEVITEFRAESAIRPGGTIMRDFRFKQPGLDLEQKESASKFADYKIYYFPGEYVDMDLGKRLAKVRMQELQSDRNRFVGVSSSRALQPGYKFTMKRHPRSSFNQDYLIVAVEHEARQPEMRLVREAGDRDTEREYQSRLVCIPASVPYRPQRVTERPTITGVQSAIVVGSKGEEIHCDEHGRVKVQFHWDREGKNDDKSSCWIRVSQPWGGAGQGGMFIPRVGQEVLIQFLEGDPDRPVVVGRVYNGESTPPHALPAGKNISTIRSSSTPGGGGFNEIKMDDTAGSEMVFIHSQFNRDEHTGNDHTTKVVNNQTESVGVDRKADVGSNETLSVGADQKQTIGANQTEEVGSNQSITVGADQTLKVGANQTVTIGSNQSVTIGANQTESIGADESITVGGNHTESIGSNMTINVGSSLTETVAVNYAETVGAAMELTIGAVFMETVGAAKIVTIGAALTEDVGAVYSLSAGASIQMQAGADFGAKAGGGMTLNAGGDIGAKAGGGIGMDAGGDIGAKAGGSATIDAGSSITLKCGGASITLSSGGDIEIKGTAITIKGSGDVTIKGSKIAQN